MNRRRNKIYTLIDNMIKMHFGYEDIYEQIKCNFPDEDITFDALLDIIEERLIKII